MNRFLILVLTIITLTFSCEQKREDLDSKELESKSLAELRIMRNEIFAKHGYIFKSPDLTEYFSNMDWYKPELTDVNHLLTKQDKANIDLILKQETFLKSSEKPEEEIQLSLVKFKADSLNDIQKKAINIYLNSNKGMIVDDFNRFWGYDIGAKSYKFKVLTQSIFSNSNETLAVIKLEVKGQAEKSSGTAYNNYMLSMETNSKLIYETGFFQPECSTPDISILSVSTLNISDTAYPTLERQSKKHACCGQASEEQIDWLILSENFKDSLATLENYFYSDNLMDCGPTNPPPPVTRKTNLYNAKGKLSAKTVFFEGEKESKTVERTINF